MTRPARLGFSLLEIVVAVAILAILVAIAIPLMSGQKRKTQLNDTTRTLLGNITRAKQLAVKGQTSSTWAASDRTVSAGIRIASPTQYAVFIDRDGITDGDEVDVAVVDFTTTDAATELRITSPAAPAEIRYRSNGTLSTPAQVDVVIEDSGTQISHTVRVSPGGAVKQLL